MKLPTINVDVLFRMVRGDAEPTVRPFRLSPSFTSPTTPNIKEEIMPNDTSTDTAAAKPETPAIPADQRDKLEAAGKILEILAPFSSGATYDILGVVSHTRGESL